MESLRLGWPLRPISLLLFILFPLTRPCLKSSVACFNDFENIHITFEDDVIYVILDNIFIFLVLMFCIRSNLSYWWNITWCLDCVMHVKSRNYCLWIKTSSLSFHFFKMSISLWSFSHLWILFFIVEGGGVGFLVIAYR